MNDSIGEHTRLTRVEGATIDGEDIYQLEDTERARGWIMANESSFVEVPE